MKYNIKNFMLNVSNRDSQHKVLIIKKAVSLKDTALFVYKNFYLSS